MHENNFEKQVREKMDQLQFDPSDAVWANVDKEINKDKRRRLPLFWLVFPLALIMAGGGYYFLVKESKTHAILTGNKQNTANKNLQKPSPGNDEISKDEGKSENRTDEKLEHRPDKPGDYNNKKRPQSMTGSGEEETKSVAKVPVSDKMNKVITERKENDVNKNGYSETGIQNKDSSDRRAGNDGNNKTVASDSVSQGKTVKNMGRKKKSFSWRIGYNGSAGISNLNQNLFESVGRVGSAYSLNTPISVTLGNPGAASASGLSEIHPGFSFGISVFAGRHLSERVSFSAGIGYHYYSAVIHTGHFIDSTTVLSIPAFGLSSVNAFYSNGKDHAYTNQYHFIELPASLDFQINKSKRLPVILEGGFTLSYLFSSNALQFDPYSNVYYKDNDLLNKTQVSAAAALMIGLPVHKGSLQIGPQFQYGLTEVLKSSTGISEHLIYYGLKVSIIPGKK